MNIYLSPAKIVDVAPNSGYHHHHRELFSEQTDR